MLEGAIFRQHLPKHIGLICIAVADQLGKNALLFAAEDVAVEMVPVRYLDTSAVSALCFQRIIDRERRNILAYGMSGHAQFQRETTHGFLSPRCHDAHDFSAALVCRHGRSPLFLGSG